MSLPKLTYPTFEVVIPSTKKKTLLRPMTVREEKILLMAKEANRDEMNLGEMFHAVKQVLYSCLPEELDKSKITTFDVEYLFLKLRSISVSNIVNITYFENKKEYKIPVDLNEVNVKWPENTPDLIKIKDDSGIKLRYPTAALFDNPVYQDPLSTPSQLFDELIVECLESYFEGDNVYPFTQETPENIKEFVNNLDIKTYNEIKHFISNLPTLYHEVDFGGKEPLVLSSLTDFFQF